MKNPFSVILILVAVLLLAAVVFVLIMGPQTLMARMMGDSTSPGNLDTAATDYQSSRNSKSATPALTCQSPQPNPQLDPACRNSRRTNRRTGRDHCQWRDAAARTRAPTQPMVTQNLGGGDYLSKA